VNQLTDQQLLREYADARRKLRLPNGGRFVATDFSHLSDEWTGELLEAGSSRPFNPNSEVAR